MDDPPKEFLCPISNSLMADPVIISSGESFDRPCIQACVDLDFIPLSLSDPNSNPNPNSPIVLIPNTRLKNAILNWCERSGHPPPLPLAPHAAREIVRSFMAPRTVGTRRNQKATSTEEDCTEEEILIKLMDSIPSDQEEAMISLREATRGGRERRLSLCTRRLLEVISRILSSPDPGVQINAAAAIVNLSLEPENKVRIVRSGVVPPLVAVLRSGHPEARDHAAGAIHSLAVADDNRTVIGFLGAIQPLLQLFSDPVESPRTRRDAGMALYYLSLVGNNRSKLSMIPGTAQMMLDMAAGEDAAVAGLRRPAVMVLANLAGCKEGRAALMDGGAVAALVAVMAATAGTKEEEYCLSALHEMSRGSVRFRGIARMAGAEKLLMKVAEEGGGMRSDMARKTLRAMRGEAEEEEYDNASIVSDGLMSIRGRHGRNNFWYSPDHNTTEF
ncbi:U-box domain-containing protein 39-like [Typha angustifolia]|uniref:U-box domain-containing protein 39-like n=1 Tax=Typha angustifolia TaxID=59011 RepID=UPI003C2B027E